MQINTVVMFAACVLNTAACGFVPRKGDLCDGFVYDKREGYTDCPLSWPYRGQSQIDCLKYRHPDHKIGDYMIDNAADLRRVLTVYGYDFRQTGDTFKVITNAWMPRDPSNACPSLHSDDQDDLIDLHPRRCVSNRVWNEHIAMPISPVNGLVIDHYRSDKGWVAYGAAIPRVMGEILSAFWLRKIANILRVKAEELAAIPSIPGTCDDCLQEGCSLTRKVGTSSSTYYVEIESYEDRDTVTIKAVHMDKGQRIGETETIGHWTM